MAGSSLRSRNKHPTCAGVKGIEPLGKVVNGVEYEGAFVRALNDVAQTVAGGLRYLERGLTTCAFCDGAEKRQTSG